MATPVHVFNIPAGSKRVADIAGKRFDATIYETEGGQLAAYVEADKDATDAELAAEQMNTKIKDAAAKTANGRIVDYYAIRRR